MEQRVIVLRTSPLVIFTSLSIIVIFAIVVVIECISWKRTCFYSSAQGFGAHLSAGSVRLLIDKAVFRFLVTELGIVLGAGRVQSDALGCSASGGIGDGEHSDDGADDDRSCAGAASADQGIALLVIRLHADSGHGEVGAVDGDHG